MILTPLLLSEKHVDVSINPPVEEPPEHHTTPFHLCKAALLVDFGRLPTEIALQLRVTRCPRGAKKQPQPPPSVLDPWVLLRIFAMGLKVADSNGIRKKWGRIVCDLWISHKVVAPSLKRFLSHLPPVASECARGEMPSMKCSCCAGQECDGTSWSSTAPLYTPGNTGHFGCGQ